MDIKIIANSKEGFEKIENSLKLFDENFIKKFNIAEDGILGDRINLIANNYYDDKIYLSVDKITNVSFVMNQSYEKINEEIKEINKYNLSIQCEKSGKKFEFNFNDRNRPNIKIFNS